MAGVSGKKSKELRRTERHRPAYLVNARYANESADRVLGVDLSGVPLSRTNQFIVGWLRAFFEQSRVIATLTAANMAPAAAPNRRMFTEIALRLHWLHDLAPEDRAGAADAMLEHEREQTVKTFEHMRVMGWESAVDLTDMNAFVLDETKNGRIKDQARKIAAAAHSTDVKNAGLFRAWREESSYAHASGYLAGAYAPASNNKLGGGTPPVTDSDLEAHRLVTLFVVTLAHQLLRENETAEPVAMSFVNAFFEV